jgi:hypothetical protein
MWHRHRSAPASAWFAASLGLIANVAVFATLDALVVRPATQQSSFTRGLRRSSLASPAHERAVYRVVLRPVEGAASPSGARVVAHRWRIDRAALRPSEGARPAIIGEDTTCVAEADRVRVSLALPLRANEWGDGVALDVPQRLRAVVPEAAEVGARYTEWRVRDGQRADVVGCVRVVEGRQSLVDCDDGGVSRVFLLPSRAIARERAMLALERISAAAGAFAIAAVLAGFSALAVWKRGAR